MDRDLSEPAFGDLAESSQLFDALFEVPAEPQRLGQFAVLGTVGRGAMGTVFEAFDPALDRRVALKVLHRDVPDRNRQRLVREARALAKVDHPGIAQVYDVGVADGRTFIATELVRGRTLTKWLEQEPRPSWREVLAVYLQSGEALAAAHAAGFVHRDFKPGNAVIDDEGRVRLLEFGLAALQGDDEGWAGIDLREMDLEQRLSLMGTGAVLGTPAYMPLEQMRGEPSDPRSDQFGFCVSVYEALYGERPYDDASMDALIDAMTHERVRPAPEGSPVPERVREALLRGLAADPEARWPSMEPLLDELRQAAAPWRERLRLLGIGALAAAGLGLVLALALTTTSGSSEGAVDARCEGAEVPLRGVWDDGRKQQVSRAILDTQRSFALDTWERVERGLDDYAAAWASRHGALCEAIESEGEASAELGERWACLRGRLDALRTTVDWLAGADEATVQGAVEVMDQNLPPLAGCDEAGAAGADGGGPAATHRAEAASLSRRGVALRKQGQLADALDHHQRALAIRQRTLDSRSVGVARTLTNIGIVLTAQGQLADALARHREALAIREEVLGPLHPYVAGSLTNIGIVLSRQGKPDEALVACRRALKIYEQAYGPRHPMVASQLVVLGRIALAQHDFEQARGYAERAVQLREAEDVHATPGEQAEARFVLAQALLPVPSERSRALALAERARDALAARGSEGSAERAAIEAWLEQSKALLGPTGSP